MKTEQILLILAGFYFFSQMRRPQAPQQVMIPQTTSQNTGSAGNQSSGGSVDTSQYFDPSQSNGQSGGDASRDDSSWDAQTKPARDAIGGVLCAISGNALPGCPK